MNPRGRKTLARNPAWDFLKVADLTDDLEAVLHKALAKDRQCRYQSVAALAEDLQRHLCGAAVQAEVDHFQVLRRTIRRYRLVVMIAVFQTVTLVAACWLWSRAGSQARRAETTVDIAYSTLNHVVRRIEQSAHHFAGTTAAQEALLAALAADLADLQAHDEEGDSPRPGAALLRDLAVRLGRPDDAAEFYRAFLEASLRLAERADPESCY